MPLSGPITEIDFADTFGRNVKGVPFTPRKALPLRARGRSSSRVATCLAAP
jgi:hypothetical protein